MEESVHKAWKPSLPAKENRVKTPEWETIVKSSIKLGLLFYSP
jgi:hypothetical protein